LVSGKRGRKPDEQKLLDATQEAAIKPGFAVTGHTWTGAVPGKPQMSWLFAAAAAENTPKT
jgi:hypothetical protein